ncbi:MAG TPA: hypothetical protein VIJ11_07110 [Galbitalea sp.]
MEVQANESKTSGPTVILLGGLMTVEDGSTLDSRQPITDDPQCRIMRTCLAGSMRWWLTAISLVQPLLRAAGNDAFCLIIGGRTLLELEADGSMRRTGLRSVVPGGLSRVEIVRTGIEESLDPKYEPAGKMDPSWNGTSMGEIGLLHSEPRRPWRVLDGNEWYLKQAGPTLRPAVIIDTTEGVLLDRTFETLSTRRLFDEQITLVLPHTRAAERYIRAYARATAPDQLVAPAIAPPPWDPDFERYIGAAARATHPDQLVAPAITPPPWDPDAPPDPVRYTKLIPIEASFGVTGLVQRQQWKDPSDLEAARALLEARFDLQIGIWDLVGNATLRQTLLKPIPAVPPPAEAAPIPARAAKRATTHVGEKIAEATAEQQALESIAKHFAPLLRSGWEANQRVRWFLRLPLTETVRRWSGEEPFPLVQLEFIVRKRQCYVTVFAMMYNRVNIDNYVLARRAILDQIASPNDCPLGPSLRPLLWQAVGGWADDIDWDDCAVALAQRTEQWTVVFEEFCNEARRMHQETSESWQ